MAGSESRSDMRNFASRFARDGLRRVTARAGTRHGRVQVNGGKDTNDSELQLPAHVQNDYLLASERSNRCSPGHCRRDTVLAVLMLFLWRDASNASSLRAWG